MSFKNKVIVLVVCVITAVSGIFAGPANIVRAEDLATISTAGMSLDQLQQLIIKLQEQIDYIVQILAQQKPVCGNGACETAKGETAASCAQDCGTICQTVANLGGVLKQQAALISWNGKLIITGTGGDDALWAYEYVVNDTSKNKPWYSLAGIIKPGTQMKMAASSGGAEIIAESIGSDGQLWARKYTSSNSAWSDWVLASTFSTDTVNNFVAGPFEAILTASTSDPDYGYVFKTALNSDGSTSIIKCQKKAALVCGRTNLLPGDNARCTAAGGTFSCPNAACYDGKSANCVGARCTCKCNTNCAKEGEKIYMWQPQAYGLSKTPATAPRVCCADLTPYGGANENVIDGKCVRNQYTVMNATLTCIKCGDGVCNASAGENICSCAADCGGSSIFIPVNITTKSSQNPASISATFNVRVAAKSGDVYIPKVNAFTVKAVKDNGSDTAAWLNVISNYSQPAGTVLTNNSIKIFQGTTANFIVTAEHMITAVPGSYDLRITGIGWNANDSAIYSVYVPDSFYGWRSEAVYFGNAICGNSTCDVGETAVSCPQDCPKAGQSCTSGGQCASGKCLNGVCCAGGQCGNAGKCYNKDATATIDGVTQKCVYEATWKYVDNTRCTALSQCASGKCLNGVCCAGGQCGNAGKCYNKDATATIDGATQVCYSEGVWKNANITTCTSGGQCASGKCLNGVCCAGGQCGNAGKCYNKDATATIDGVTKVCYSEATWKDVDATACTYGSQCASGKCLNGVCCAGGQCGNAGKCYNKDATATIDGVTQKCVYEATWKYVDNTRCTALSQCASGKCLNGVCCAGGQCGNAGKCYSQNTTAVIDGATQVCYSEGTWKIQ